MNYVDETQDGVVRQVVPADFSFLSSADRSIVKAMGKILCQLTGLNDDVPIFLGTPAINKVSALRQWSYGRGLMLYQGELYDFEGASSTAEYDTWQEFLKGVYLTPMSKSVDPSPVYGEGLNRDVYVHKKYIMSTTQANDNSFKLEDIQLIPTLNENEDGSVSLNRTPIKTLG